MLSAAFVAYARDLKHDPAVGIIYVDTELKPTPPSASELLTAAAQAPSLADYVQQMGWMNPIYAKLRQAIASRMYRKPAQYRLLAAQPGAGAGASRGRRPLRHRQSAGGAALHVRERSGGGLDARRRRAAPTRSRRRR